jgi:ABC-2 type transport system permease protein
MNGLTMLRLMRADWLKTRRTPLRLAILAAPAAYAVMLLLYFANRRVTPELPRDMLAAFAEGWTALLPLVIGLLAGLFALQEEHAGNFSALLGSTAPRPAVYAARLLQLALIHTGSVLCAVTLLRLGMMLRPGIPVPDAGMFCACALLAAAGALPLIALHQWLALAAGWGASVGAGGAGLLIGAIVGATAVGDRVWPFVPWAWPVRLSMLPLAPHPPTVMLIRALAFSLIAFALLAAGGTAWFNRWEGRRGED